MLPVDLFGLRMVDRAADGLSDDSIAAIIDAVEIAIGRPAADVAKEAESKSALVSAELQLFEYAMALDVAAGFQHYLDTYPQGHFAWVANRELEKAHQAAAQTRKEQDAAQSKKIADQVQIIRKRSRRALFGVCFLAIGALVATIGYFAMDPSDTVPAAEYVDLEMRFAASQVDAQVAASAAQQVINRLDSQRADAETKLAAQTARTADLSGQIAELEQRIEGLNTVSTEASERESFLRQQIETLKAQKTAAEQKLSQETQSLILFVDSE